MNLRLEIVPRTAPSTQALMMVPAITIALSVLCAIVLFTALNHSPSLVLYSFFVEPFLDSYNLSEVLIKAGPLILIAQGLAIGFRAKVWNIGAEGQLTIGAIFAALIPITWPQSQSALMLPVMILVGGLAGAAWASIAALLRTRFNASEIIVTLMLNQIAFQILLYLINGPLKDPRGFSFPQSVPFPEAAMFPPLVEDSLLRANMSIWLVLLISVLAWVFVARSFAGFRLLVGGLAPNAARYAGFSANRAIWISLLAGGVAAGIAGVGEISGPIGKLQPILSPGYGFAAIIVAFLGGLNPIGIVLAGFFMAVIFVGADGAVLAGIPASAPVVFQGFILIFYLASYTLVNFKFRRVRGGTV
ncbi:ABC transporter permease [Leisingera sp.]|uniref:ABC transporter permease n=1 Tax=Leisingera sp. TaxID=1879318 RepID=UPI002B278E7F|nr:ABC transporter permease [Leisingera sp.]